MYECLNTGVQNVFTIKRASYPRTLQSIFVIACDSLAG